MAGGKIPRHDSTREGVRVYRASLSIGSQLETGSSAEVFGIIRAVKSTDRFDGKRVWGLDAPDVLFKLILNTTRRCAGWCYIRHTLRLQVDTCYIMSTNPTPGALLDYQWWLTAT